MKQITIKDGWFKLLKSAKEKPYLLGSKCLNCGETFFPKRVLCRQCGTDALRDISLGPKGKLYSYTTVMQAPLHYKGPVPYVIGQIELPEGELVMAQLTVTDGKRLKIGMEMELMIVKIGQDEKEQDILSYKFKPIRRDNR
jgi:uncharacterized OB-fold protein